MQLVEHPGQLSGRGVGERGSDQAGAGRLDRDVAVFVAHERLRSGSPVAVEVGHGRERVVIDLGGEAQRAVDMHAAHTVLLLPGVGAQGGRAEHLAPAFAPGPAGGLISSSRGIVAAYQQTGGDPATAARAEAARLQELAWNVA